MYIADIHVTLLLFRCPNSRVTLQWAESALRTRTKCSWSWIHSRNRSKHDSWDAMLVFNLCYIYFLLFCCHILYNVPTSHLQLKQCEEDLHLLESRVEDAKDPSRIRLLPGPELSQVQCTCTYLAHREKSLATLSLTAVDPSFQHVQ